MTTTDGTVLCPDGLRRPPWATGSDLLRDYYDTEWGMPVRDDQGMYERLTLESFQSGLSWATILVKRPAFRRAFDHFDPEAVARYGSSEITRLLNDASIVRNCRKIEAAINNAQATLNLRPVGGLAELVWSFQPTTTPAPRTMAEVPTRSPESEALAAALKKAGFRFVGPTTMYALMEAVGVVDTHLVGSWRRGSSGVWG
ncbi:DNA-3-methyladenine glycosylase I [Corynebacterium oculi]|uniref:DNA-3-methyladenine glycosylase 1 n=1 Tax=Corynebacterium oculi TaxID=1544416 RepID=A0A0Q0TX51_9CORY|nr:DNA-3-methyladenine glycosylase I [Corynebacterium oculi]KQB83550.1 DNA-3-methyladenine glycosylase 1 [Corynebacterium oculi]